MSFPQKVKESLLIKCARICCVCWKKCGTNIEIDHAVQEADGGPNTEENGIPVCFDCHAEIKHYNAHHPRGNKFRPTELRAARDRVFRLVDSGAIFAQYLASQVNGRAGEFALVPQSPPPAISTDAQKLLTELQNNGEKERTPGSKIALLGYEERALILDQLISNCGDSSSSAIVAIRCSRASIFDIENSQLIRQQVAKKIALFGKWWTLIAFLEEIQAAEFQEVTELLRNAIFETSFALVTDNQYDVVNKLVPALRKHQNAVPLSLSARLIEVMLDHCSSGAYEGAPAAKQILDALPDQMVREGLSVLTDDYLCRRGHMKHVRAFVHRNAHLATGNQRESLQLFGENPQAFLATKCPNDW